jgi:SOS response regulatory protein OraA/RecX
MEDEKEARRKALRALSMRAHFPRELVRKLVGKGIEEVVAKRVVDELVKERRDAFQDVRQFVARRREAGKSSKRIAQLLFQKGFSPGEALRWVGMEE